jgi:hypothetical protein
MEAKFQSIVDNWINGNRKDAREQFEAIPNSRIGQFSEWLKVKFRDGSNYDRQTLYEIVVFLLCA